MTAHLPVYRIADFTWPATKPHTDNLGRTWFIPRGGDLTFMGPPKRRERVEDLLEADGVSLGVEHLGGKAIELTVRAWIPHHVRDQTLLELAGLCSDPTRLHELRRTTAHSDLVREVTLRSPPLDGAEWLDPRGRVDLTIGFFAPDPHAYGPWQSATPAPGSTQAGLDYSGGGLHYGAGGLDYGGIPARDVVARVLNEGTARAWPLIELRGPCEAHTTVVHAETGATARYSSPVATNEAVTLNTDLRVRRGIMPESAHSSTRGDVTSLWVRNGLIDVPPRSTATFYTAVPRAGLSPLHVALRSAWL